MENKGGRRQEVCPRCGNEDIEKRIEEETGYTYFICPECSFWTSARYDEEGARALWNRRAQSYLANLVARKPRNWFPENAEPCPVCGRRVPLMKATMPTTGRIRYLMRCECGFWSYTTKT